MKKLIFALLLLCSIQLSAQYYTYIGPAYEWRLGMFRALGLPSGDTPAFITGQTQRAGQLYYDTLGVDAGLYVWNGLTWIAVSDGGPDGNGIYGGSGALPGAVNINLNSSELTIQEGVTNTYSTFSKYYTQFQNVDGAYMGFISIRGDELAGFADVTLGAEDGIDPTMIKVDAVLNTITQTAAINKMTHLAGLGAGTVGVNTLGELIWQANSTLAGLSDVNITSVQKGQSIMYDSVSAKYINVNDNYKNRQHLSFWEDFYNGLGGARFLGSISGTGAVVTGIAAASYTNSIKRPGALVLGTGSTAAGRSSINMLAVGQNPVLFKPNEYYGEVIFETSLFLETLAIVAQDYVFYTGLGADGTTISPVNSIHFEYDRSLTGDFWVLATSSASVRSVVVTTIPVVANTWVRLEIRVNADATSVTAFINDIEVVASSGTYPITTNIFDGSYYGPAPMAIIRKTAGLTTAMRAILDYIGTTQTISPNR